MPRRMMRDRRSGYGSRRDRNYGSDYGYEQDYAENRMDYERSMRYDRGHSGRMSDYADYEDDYGDYARRGRDRARGRDYNRGYDRARNYDRNYDYGYDYAMLDDRQLMKWSKRLLEEVDDKDKQMFSLENIEKKAKEMGIKFDKFSMEEFYTTVLMVYTDYSKTLGMANADVYLKLAKDWLCDEDAELQYGEKLSAYHDYIVEGM